LHIEEVPFSILLIQDYGLIKVLHQDIGKTCAFTSLQKINNRVWGGTQRAIYVWDFDGNRIGKLEIESDMPVIAIVASGP
jgi:hypothetical protein